MAQIILDSNNNLIQGDFDNATINNRTKFKTTTTNATTNVYAVPNGSATSAGFTVTNAADPTNASKLTIATNGSTDTQIISGVNGSGTYLPLSFYTNNALAMQVATSGNVGIGTTSPLGTLGIAGSATATIVIPRSSNGTTASPVETQLIASTFTNGTYGAGIFALNSFNDTSANFLTFKTTATGNGSPTERMRITADGQVLVNSTTAPIGSAPMALKNGTINWSMGPNGNGNFILYNDSAIGVYLVNGGTSWTGTSDERVKTDLKPIENAAEKVSTLRTVTGRFKTDDKNKSRAFLIAQDVQKVLPEAVYVQDDEQGTLGLAYTDVIPLLTAAIKEQQAIINELKTRIEALESK